MSLVDERGRLFGSINLVDAVVGIVIVILIPLAYGTYLLFRPVTAPRIDEVTPSTITKTEERISVGGRVAARFKIKGNGFTSLLRARIDDVDALAFVFENPNSADLLVGPIEPGTHDLVLLDGRQEVARAKDAIVIEAITAGASMRAVGWLMNLNEDAARAIAVGTALPAQAPAYRVLALGPLVDGYRRVALAGSTIEVAVPNVHARRAALWLTCDSTVAVNPCVLGDRAENRTGPVTISLPGPSGSFNFQIDEVLPSSNPVKATLRVRLTSSAPVKAGDRDLLLDERAAAVTNVSGDMIVLQAGVDRDHDGWRYRGQRLLIGAPFSFSTDRYAAAGVVQSIDVEPSRP